MSGWIDWREIEKQNDWGVRSRNDATAELWNQAADQWNRRSEHEEDFNRRQVEALDIEPSDTVIDICCGAGPLTIWLAKKAEHVIAFDYGSNMLEHVRRRAKEAGLDNISYVQGNWHSMDPQKDFPDADIAVTRHSPAHGNILKFSRCASKYCYSLWNCAAYHKDANSPENGSAGSAVSDGSPTHSNGRPQTRGRWIKSDNPEENTGPRPDGRKYGYNVHFNLLYDWGADPEIRIVKDILEFRGSSREELYRRLARGRDLSPDLIRMFEPSVTEQPDGSYLYRRVGRIAVLGWDPNQIHFEDIDPESIL